MNIERELEDIIEIVQKELDTSIKYSHEVGEYRYGQVKAYKTCLELLQDLKNKISGAEITTISQKSENNEGQPAVFIPI